MYIVNNVNAVVGVGGSSFKHFVITNSLPAAECIVSSSQHSVVSDKIFRKYTFSQLQRKFEYIFLHVCGSLSSCVLQCQII